MNRVLASRFHEALDFASYAATLEKNADLWRGIFRMAQAPSELIERANVLREPWHLLVVTEDWCGDAVNTVPILAKFADQAEAIDLRLLARDQHPDVMQGHLTSGTRSIPVVIALDRDFEECGWWGPRPTRLQRWVRSEGLLLPKDERYRRTRTWYARDRGRTTIEEVLEILERAERRRSSPPPAIGDTFEGRSPGHNHARARGRNG